MGVVQSPVKVGGTYQMLKWVKVTVDIECSLGGIFHSVLEGFEVPKMTLANFITCWYCGNKRDKVPPLQFVKSYNLGIEMGKC